MKVVNRLVLAVSFMFASIANANVILSLAPANQEAVIGEQVSVNVMISDLGNFVPLSLGTFDIDVAFDTTALSFAGYNLFGDLGANVTTDPFDFFADAFDDSRGEYAPGVVNIAEISYLSNAELWNLQPGAFALAELFFDVIAAPVTSAIAFNFAELTDVNGDLINIVEVNNASVTGVPAPATLTLMGLGILAIVVRQKRFSPSIKKS